MSKRHKVDSVFPTKKLNDKETVHVMLSSPITLRKDILGSALDLTRMLKTYAELKEIRETKVILADSFNAIHRDMKDIIKKLEKADLPMLKTEEHAEHKALDDPKEIIHKEVKIEEASNHEIEALKAELDAIEKKLGSL